MGVTGSAMEIHWREEMLVAAGSFDESIRTNIVKSPLVWNKVALFAC